LHFDISAPLLQVSIILMCASTGLNMKTDDAGFSTPSRKFTSCRLLDMHDWQAHVKSEPKAEEFWNFKTRLNNIQRFDS
jgi:hypothetical protein